MWEDDEVYSIVIDNGSGMCRAGFAGDDAPRVLFANCVGRPKHMTSVVGTGNRETFVGDEAQRNRTMLNLSYPIDRGIVTNWDDMETILHYVYDQLVTKPEERPVLMTEPVLNPMTNKDKMAQLMFETFNVPAYYTAMQDILAVYSSGRGSAITCNSGHGVTSVLPIYEGHTFRHSYQRADIGGQDITSYLSQCLQDKGYSFTTSSELEVVRDMKEKLCYTALNYDEEMSKQQEKTYELPDNYGDGNSITLGHERFQCAEAMFQPSLLGSGSEGIHKLVYNCLMECDVDARRDLFCNIILCGGNTQFPGFCARLRKEMEALLPSSMKIRIVAYPEAKFHAWIGGSILASLSTFQNAWITKQDYDEHGPSIISRKGCI